MINNLSQFKSWLKVGKEIQFTNCIYSKEDEGKTKRILMVKNKGFFIEYMGDTVLFEFPKAKQLIFEDGKVIYTKELINKNWKRRLEEYKNNPKEYEYYLQFSSQFEKEKNELINKGVIFIDDNNYICYVFKLVA